MKLSRFQDKGIEFTEEYVIIQRLIEGVGRILITGGAGFIGSAFAQLAVAKGYDVTVLDNLSNSSDSEFEALREIGIDCILGDIRNEDAVSHAMKDCNYVVHFAAQVSVSESVRNPHETMNINVNGTQVLVNESKKSSIQKFVLASSAAVYGNNNSTPHREVEIGEELSPYAESKIKNEKQIKVLNSIGCQTFALRFFNVYGLEKSMKSGYSAVIPSFIEQMWRGENPVVFGDGKQSRDFVHIDDVCNAIFSCLEHNLRANMHFVMNVATGNSTSLVDLISELNDIMSNQSNRILQPPKFVGARAGDVLHSKGCIERISKTLGWEPSIHLREGLTRMIQQVRD